MRDKIPAALHAYLHISQLFLDQRMHLALCPLDSEIFLNLFEILPRDHGDLFGGQQGNTAAQVV